jgi:hypothetical protein
MATQIISTHFSLLNFILSSNLLNNAFFRLILSLCCYRGEYAEMTTLSNLAELPNLINRVIESPGQPLEPAIRSFMESVLPQKISRISPCSVESIAQFPPFIMTSSQNAYELEAESIANELTTLEEIPVSAACHPKKLDLSQVRVHTDKKSAESALALNAHAFTCGNHIVFAAGKYAPDTIPGLHLLAHELIHTLQQRYSLMRFVQRAETDTEATLRGSTKLIDSAPDVNKRITQAINNARAIAKGNAALVISGLYQELGENDFSNVGRTKIEVWAETLGSKKVHQPPQNITKYAGVRYRLWLQAHWGLFPILNPTMLINGIYVGSDKLGHFLQQGHEYYEIVKSKGASGVQEAENYGKETETGGFGLRTTGIMSHADLEANRQGLKFYQQLYTDSKMVFDIANYINKKWNEGYNPNYYEETVGKYVWTNLLGGRVWKGTIKDRGFSSQVTAKLKVSNDVNMTGEFSYIQKIGGKITGKIINGKIVHLKNTDNAIRGVRIDFEWQLNQPSGAKGSSSGKGYWESAGETKLIGKWGWGEKNGSRGEWMLAK